MRDESAAPIGPDIGAVFDAHVAYEFETKDLDATMGTMTAAPHVTHVPTFAGGVGAEDVRRFYGAHFIGHWPDDTRITHVSRDRWCRPCRRRDGHALHPRHRHGHLLARRRRRRGRPVQLPVVVVAGFEGDKVAFERIYWDQASLLVQVGLLDAARLPVCGVEQAAKVLDEDLPCNALIERGRS